MGHIHSAAAQGGLAGKGVAYGGRAKNAELLEALRAWAEGHPEGEAQGEEDMSQGERAERGPPYSDLRNLPGTGSSIFTQRLSPEELEDSREERKLRPELAKSTKEQALALAELEKEQALILQRLAMEGQKWQIS
ncbi:hypothetical protein NDU88_007318 [Pleurodeles waltl]|uniref:Uncharacterized protein n=1 Tax=Pleurodeles waltl TaxID=8319 RepID=A0AAV7SS60_PLEWA|nr:hypothetical protein NDU88_007318 [Pleurodeles waltl]